MHKSPQLSPGGLLLLVVVQDGADAVRLRVTVVKHKGQPRHAPQLQLPPHGGTHGNQTALQQLLELHLRGKVRGQAPPARRTRWSGEPMAVAQ